VLSVLPAFLILMHDPLPGLNGVGTVVSGILFHKLLLSG
jgi:hypothetical protein